MSLSRIAALAALVLLPACGSLRPAQSAPPADEKSAAAPADAPPKKEKESRGFLMGVVMYLPDRVFDLFDVARAGVNVGPGVGIQLKATDAVQLTAMARTSLGLGLETLRHSPVAAGAETSAEMSIVGAGADAGLTWPQSPTDIRVELHPLIVGAHAAVDPVEILDFVLGFVLIDIRDDDL
jgi:hypothetical protein